MSAHNIKADYKTLTQIQETLLFNPEAINMFCSYIVYKLGNQSASDMILTPQITALILKDYVSSLGGEFETYLDTYTKNEVKVLTLIAKLGSLKNPMGKDALGKLKISASGLRKILDKLLDHADIYREEVGFVLGVLSA